MSKVKFGNVTKKDFGPIELDIMLNLHGAIEVASEASPYRELRFHNLRLRKTGCGTVDISLKDLTHFTFNHNDKDAYTLDDEGYVIKVDEGEEATEQEKRSIREAVQRLKEKGWVETKIEEATRPKRFFKGTGKFSPDREVLVIAQVDNWKIFNPQTMQYFSPE